MKITKTEKGVIGVIIAMLVVVAVSVALTVKTINDAGA